MQKMKSVWHLCVLLCLAVALVCTAAAAERTVYVSTGGTGDGTSAASPVGSLGVAVNALGGEGGTVVFVSPVTLGTAYTVPEQSGDLTFTAEGSGCLNLAANLTFAKNTNANLITLDLPITADGEQVIFGGYNTCISPRSAPWRPQLTSSAAWTRRRARRISRVMRHRTAC